MILLDTNIIIYLAQGRLPRQTIAHTDIAHASVTKIEALGFSNIDVGELLRLQAFFSQSYQIELDAIVTKTAIELRQIKAMSLGDAIIAATALEHNLTLWTANVADFKHIDGLKVFNPLSLPTEPKNTQKPAP